MFTLQGKNISVKKKKKKETERGLRVGKKNLMNGLYSLDLHVHVSSVLRRFQAQSGQAPVEEP